jgi:hypothetical protein
MNCSTNPYVKKIVELNSVISMQTQKRFDLESLYSSELKIFLKSLDTNFMDLEDWDYEFRNRDFIKNLLNDIFATDDIIFNAEQNILKISKFLRK